MGCQEQAWARWLTPTCHLWVRWNIFLTMSGYFVQRKSLSFFFLGLFIFVTTKQYLVAFQGTFPGQHHPQQQHQQPQQQQQGSSQSAGGGSPGMCPPPPAPLDQSPPEAGGGGPAAGWAPDNTNYPGNECVVNNCRYDDKFEYVYPR